MDEVSLAEMMAPIAGADPVGTDVRAAGPGSELYLSIKDERAAARGAEREALASGDPELQPLAAGLKLWTAVARSGGTLLAEHAKDLQIAAWVTEAWLRTDGFAGLADGFTLLAELVDSYWDEGLFPVEDEDGLETRLAPLFGLFGRDEPGALLQPIKLLPLTDRSGDHVALWTVEATRAQTARHDDPDMREELVARRTQRLAQLDAAVAGASATFVAQNLEAIERAQAEMERLMTVLDGRTPFGRFGSQVAASLAACADILRQHHVLTSAGVPAGDVAVAPSEDDRVPAASAPKQNVLDRQGALATLLEIAGFFDRTEPQSLIGQGLREVVRRANLPLDDLLAELLPDSEQRAMFLLRAGVRATPAARDGFSTF